MKNKILEIISEQQSPLFRIMSGYNANEPARRTFDNNICASHIGNGYILSVAHNLVSEAKLVKSMSETEFQNEFISKCNANDQLLFNKCYQLDSNTNKRYINIKDKNDVPKLIEAFNKLNYDTRWVTLYSKNICKPYLIIQFKNNEFYNDNTITPLFNKNYIFPEPGLNMHTFLVELELVKTFWTQDISIYKISDSTDQKIKSKIPFANISYKLSDVASSLYCLQGSPSGTGLGRMVNESRIEGLLDHHSLLPDRIGGNIILEGHRYLLKGYFRFGSSGAPYLSYDSTNRIFTVNAVQSEASPIQLSIKNDKEGNFQYINAIASPLIILKKEIEEVIN